MIFLSTSTKYSFSLLFLERKILLTTEPSFVKRIKPSESLSSLPIGKILSGKKIAVTKGEKTQEYQAKNIIIATGAR